MALPAIAMALKTPKAVARSRPLVKVVVTSDSAAGASSAPKMPCRARAPNSMPVLTAEPAERGGQGEADQAGEEDALAADHVAEPAAEQQQTTEGEGVRGDDPLPAGVGEPEIGLHAGQSDGDDGAVQQHHQLGYGDER